MKAPSTAQWTFCAATAMSVPARAWTAALSETNGGQTATSTPSSHSSRSRSERQNAAASSPCTSSSCRRSALRILLPPGSPPRRAAPCPRAARARRRRRSRPSRSGRRGRASSSARTESPPPTTVYASASAIGLGDRLRALGEARPLEDAHRAVPEDRLRHRDPLREGLAGLGADVEAEPALGHRVGRHDLRLRVGLERGGGDDVARQLDRKVERVLARSSSAILPPTRTTSARPPRFCSTPSLSSTLAPPETSTKGRSTSPSSLPSSSSSRSSSSPA